MHNALIIPDNYKILFDNDKESPTELKGSLSAVANTLIPALKHISLDEINRDVKLFKPLSGEAGDA